MTSLSVLIVVNNEEKQLRECLRTISFADEIVIILDKCTDRSKSIAKKFTKKIFSGAWKIEGDRRNFGLKKCKKEWILEIDADERVSKELRNEIICKIKENSCDWHLIRINNYLGKKIIKDGWGAYFGKSAYAGLFRNGIKQWSRQRVHPKIFLKGKKGKTLNNKLEHFYCKNITDLFVKLDSYSSARAIDLKYDSSEENYFRNVRRIFSRFWKCFVLRKGYREKKYGFLIALVACLYPIISYIKFKFNNNA